MVGKEVFLLIPMPPQQTSKRENSADECRSKKDLLLDTEGGRSVICFENLMASPVSSSDLWSDVLKQTILLRNAARQSTVIDAR